MNGLTDFLNTSLNVDFISLDPFTKIKTPEKIKFSSKYAVCFGLAIRESIKDV